MRPLGYLRRRTRARRLPRLEQLRSSRSPTYGWSIGRANLDGSSVQLDFITGLTGGLPLAVGGS